MAARGAAIHSTPNRINHLSSGINQPYRVSYLRIAGKSNRFSVSAAIRRMDQRILSSPPGEVSKEDPHSRTAVLSENSIDSWIQQSVTHIVQNLKQAPLLVQIFSENDGVSAKIKTEEANSWPFSKVEGDNGVKSPDVLMFVKELDKSDNDEGVNKFWGIVVQRKGTDSAPKCYLLKTSRICAGIGLGSCTHFCLMNVINFRDCASDQFKDCWSLQ